jgi:hypothetical protein
MFPQRWMVSLVLLLAACPPPTRLQAGSVAGTVVFRISSEPAGASVSVDGVVLATTPLEALLAPGQHQLHLAKSGYLPLDTLLQVPATGGAFTGTLAASH